MASSEELGSSFITIFLVFCGLWLVFFFAFLTLLTFINNSITLSSTFIYWAGWIIGFISLLLSCIVIYYWQDKKSLNN